MENSLYVSLSGQIALQSRLDTIAHNVANSSTPGFRAENVTFDSIVSKSSNAGVTYAGRPDATYALNSGAITATGNPLDVAIRGDAFLAMSTDAGVVYTRDGRMRISTAGDLETLSGHAVLDQGGAPIQLNPGNGPISIASNGVISQNGNRVATLGLFKLAAESRLTRHAGSGLVPDRPAEPVVDFTATGLVQGYVEQSNVNPILEMTRLISVSRSFEAISAMIDKSDGTMSNAIRTLGSGSGR